MNIIINILYASWQIFLESAVYMLFGFFVAGVLYVFLKPEKIGRYLGRGKVRSVFLSALAGIPIPLCSCGVVPAAAGLKRQGANNGATLSFLISTPESGMDSIPITYALMDPVITVIRPVAAFITAIVAGTAENFFGNSDDESKPALPSSCSASGECGCNGSSSNPSEPTAISLTARMISGLKYAFVDLLGDIGKWFIVGVLLAGLISCFIPDTLFESYLANHFIAMLVMLLVGLPMYVCATSSTPIAAALVLKGLNPGAALVFLLAGPATNIASLCMVSGLLGKRSLLIYLGSIAVCSLVLGFFTDMLYFGIGVTAKASAGKATEIFPYYVEFAGAAVLAILLAFAIWKNYKGQGSCC
ncbi:MAG: SO_0444 family Cu/Zn efflux transporter [Pseudomonadota bacterium]|nr:SO_0444 family Cu/Zn efflux transporter [Desulfobacterales bacterium]MBU0699214.1 SO_0444 family Cu/Zn efflux transporter [Pseudomonadota bacterium]